MGTFVTTQYTSGPYSLSLPSVTCFPSGLVANPEQDFLTNCSNRFGRARLYELRPSCRTLVATFIMRPSVLTLLSLVVRLQLAFSPISATRAELHYQRQLPGHSSAADPGEELSIHASASHATFAIGDHLLKWLAEHPAQHLTARRTADLTAEDVVFIVMVCPVVGIIM